MEPSESIAFLRRYNHWRRGGEMDQPHPYQIGQALDTLCDHAERLERELATERALADRLAQELEGCAELTSAQEALAAWKEARK